MVTRKYCVYIHIDIYDDKKRVFDPDNEDIPMIIKNDKKNGPSIAVRNKKKIRILIYFYSIKYLPIIKCILDTNLLIFFKTILFEILFPVRPFSY